MAQQTLKINFPNQRTLDTFVDWLQNSGEQEYFASADYDENGEYVDRFDMPRDPSNNYRLVDNTIQASFLSPHLI